MAHQKTTDRKAIDPEELLQTSQAARVLNRSADTVRKMTATGRLPAVRTASGLRLYKRGDVEKMREELEAAKKRQAG